MPATLLNQSGGALSKLITREGVALLQGDSQWLFLSKFEVGIVSFWLVSTDNVFKQAESWLPLL